MSAPTYIPDGYTRPFRLKPPEEHLDLYGELRGEYRPMIDEQRERLTNSLHAYKNNAKDAAIASAKLILPHLLSWDAVYPEGHKQAGQPVELSEANIRRLQPRLRIRLVDMVCGYSPSDPLDDNGAPEADGDAMMRAIEEGRPLPLVEQEADAKN